jgi:hypothetical protein
MAQPEEHTSDDELSPCAHIEEKEILIAAERGEISSTVQQLPQVDVWVTFFASTARVSNRGGHPQDKTDP